MKSLAYGQSYSICKSNIRTAHFLESHTRVSSLHPQSELQWSISLDMYCESPSAEEVTQDEPSNHLRHFPGISFSAIIAALLVVSFNISPADASKDKHHVKKCGLPNNAVCVANEDCESGLCLFDIGAQANICEPGPLVSTSCTIGFSIIYR
jgi:hypothetical protein